MFTLEHRGSFLAESGKRLVGTAALKSKKMKKIMVEPTTYH